jgi:hypothetical protein
MVNKYTCQYTEFQKHMRARPEMSRLNNGLQLDSVCIKETLKCIQTHQNMSKFGEPNTALKQCEPTTQNEQSE